MAGRGRGRGRATTFNLEQLGFNRGDALPPPILQPPPLFPSLEYKPLPLASSEELDYMLALKQEFRGTMRSSVYFIHPTEVKKECIRYSEKCKENEQITETLDKHIDWRRIPSELKPKLKKRKSTTAVPHLSKRNDAKTRALPVANLDEKLKVLESQEKETSEVEDEEKKEEDEDEDREVEEDLDNYDEEQEEETDYISSYFDNGENYNDDEDDNLDDGAIY